MPKIAVVNSLMDDKARNIETIVENTDLSANEISRVLEELEQQGIVVSRETENGILFSLEHAISAFTSVAKLFLDGQQRFDFLLSQYSKSMNNAQLIEYVSSLSPHP